MSKSLKDKTLTAFVWVALDKLAGSLVNFVITIILARLLVPEDFGLVAMVALFFEIAESFIQSGVGTALIRESTISEVEKSTAFIFNVAVSVAVYILLFLAAPFIAAFFAQEKLVLLIRVMGLTLIVSACAIIQRAVLAQNIDFRTQTLIRIAAVAVSGVTAVALAGAGAGVWSLVARMGIMEVIATALLWVFNPWKPLLRFSMETFRRLFGFGSRILLESLLEKTFRNTLQLVIGKMYSASTLGFFSQAITFRNMAAYNFGQAIQQTTYPVLAKLKDDLPRLKEAYRRIISMSSFVILPVMALMCVLAEPLIVGLTGEKWAETVPYLQLLCIAGATYHFHAINLNVLLVLGRVDLSLRVDVAKLATAVLLMAIGLSFGIFGLIAGKVIAFYIALYINTYYSERLLGYSLWEQIKDLLHSLVFSLIACIPALFCLSFAKTAPLLALFSGALSGAALYFALHYFARTKEFETVKALVSSKIFNRT
jgi:O-antigen/teichoic acid export membrane protein